MHKILPNQLKYFLHNRLKECLGILIFSFIAILLISILSFSSKDSAFFSASNFETQNYFNSFGALCSDIILQFFGISIIFWLMVSAHQAIYFTLYKNFSKKLLIYTFIAMILFQTIINFFNFSYTLLQFKGIIPWIFVRISPLPQFFNIIIACAGIALCFIPFINISYKDLISFERFNKKEKLHKEKISPTLNVSNRNTETEEEELYKSTNKTIQHAQNFILPDINLLEIHKQSTKSAPAQDFEKLAQQLEKVLKEYGIKGEIQKIHPGPVVTLYEFDPAPGIKTSRIISLSDDIARSMSALSARIAVIPGQSVIGIELPNLSRKVVFLRELLESKEFQNNTEKLTLALGQNISGQPIMVDLTKMPHLLVAGTTGSGKSVAVNTMILSLLYRLTPQQCRFVMIDPKMLELSVYDGIPHLLAPVVTDPKKAINALKWAVHEMENRYAKMSKLGVRNIDNYNQRILESRDNGEVLIKRSQVGFDEESGKPIFENETLQYEKLPHIVIVVDEMADLMMVAGKEIESCVQRLAQMARAAGIHLIMATQRPSVDVITGTIKANFPTRISFHVTSKIDSRTILGEQGAEQLLGQGDMLYMASGGKITRIHGPFVKDQEVEKIVNHLKTQGKPEFSININLEDEAGVNFDDDDLDPMFQKAVDLIMQEGKVSTSRIQRQFKIGYNRAARIIDEMEGKGIVSNADHTGKRQILAR